MKILNLIIFINFLCLDNYANLSLKLFNTLSLEDKIAQLFIIGISNKDFLPKTISIEKNNRFYLNEQTDIFNKDKAEKIIKKYKIGGVHFIHYGTLESSINAINYVNAISSLPLLVSQDFEWGLNMRLVDAVKFPFNMTLGAIQNDDLIYLLGCEIARQCKMLGVHINFAPVVDINCNPLNPVINIRSFGQDKVNVAFKSLAFINGLQDNGIIACAKHFCGHGDTDTDSHLELPTIKHNLERLNTIELYPFKVIINTVKAIMPAHIHVPAIDPTAHTPLTLSYAGITELLINNLKFKGLIITDALNMRAITNYFAPGEAELQALIAGNDMLLMSPDPETAINYIKTAIINNIIDIEIINKKVLKILKLKEDLGLLSNPSIRYTAEIISEFNTPFTYNIQKKLYESAITLICEDQNTLPLDKNSNIAYISTGIQNNSNIDIENINIDSLNSYDAIVLSILGITNNIKSNYGIKDSTLNFIEALKKRKSNSKFILILFGNPYCLSLFNDFNRISCVLMGYEDDPAAQKAALSALFSTEKPTGKLPITI